MAEENPHIEIKKLPKPIENSREQYLFENEKYILGRPGFIFRSYPTLKERLQESLREQKEYNLNISKITVFLMFMSGLFFRTFFQKHKTRT